MGFWVEYQEDGMESPEFVEFLFMTWMLPGVSGGSERACRQCKDRDAAQVDVNINN